MRAIAPARASRVEVARATGPLDRLKGRRVFLLVDDDNLRLGARDLGCRLSYRSLGELIRATTAEVELHTVISHWPGDGKRASYFTARGWVSHPREIREIPTANGSWQSANADFYIAFLAGLMAAHLDYDLLIVGSGDGELVEDIAWGIQRHGSGRRVMTMSLAGSTAQRLNARSSSLIEENIEIGLDCLRPIIRKGTCNGYR